MARTKKSVKISKRNAGNATNCNNCNCDNVKMQAQTEFETPTRRAHTGTTPSKQAGLYGKRQKQQNQRQSGKQCRDCE
jgi:hypothetical protein